MIYIKIHRGGEFSGYRTVVAACDENLVGKTLKEKGREFKISEAFCKGDKKTEAEVIEILKTAHNVNLVGEEAVNAGIKAGIIQKENVIKINGVPHGQAIAF